MKRSIGVTALGIFDIVIGLWLFLSYLSLEWAYPFLMRRFLAIMLLIIGILILKLKPIGKILGLYLAPLLIIFLGIITPHGFAVFLSTFFTRVPFILLMFFLFLFHSLLLSHPKIRKQFAGVVKEGDVAGALTIKESSSLPTIRISALIYFLIGLENFFWAAVCNPGYSIEGARERDLLLGITFTSVSIINFLLSFIKHKEIVREVIFSLFLIAVFICIVVQWKHFSPSPGQSSAKIPFFTELMIMLTLMHDSLISLIFLIIMFFRIFYQGKTS